MELLDSVFSQLNHWHWFALAFILGILDVSIGALFVLLWCGVAAAIVGFLLIIFPSMQWEYQFIVFAIGVMTSILVWRHYLTKHKAPSDKPFLNRRGTQYVGREFTLEEAIVNGRGKVKVDDTIWRVEGSDLPVGTRVKVTDVDGVVLKVESV